MLSFYSCALVRAASETGQNIQYAARNWTYMNKPFGFWRTVANTGFRRLNDESVSRNYFVSINIGFTFRSFGWSRARVLLTLNLCNDACDWLAGTCNATVSTAANCICHGKMAREARGMVTRAIVVSVTLLIGMLRSCFNNSQCVVGSLFAPSHNSCLHGPLFSNKPKLTSNWFLLESFTPWCCGNGAVTIMSVTACKRLIGWQSPTPQSPLSVLLTTRMLTLARESVTLGDKRYHRNYFW